MSKRKSQIEAHAFEKFMKKKAKEEKERSESFKAETKKKKEEKTAKLKAEKAKADREAENKRRYDAMKAEKKRLKAEKEKAEADASTVDRKKAEPKKIGQDKAARNKAVAAETFKQMPDSQSDIKEASEKLSDPVLISEETAAEKTEIEKNVTEESLLQGAVPIDSLGIDSRILKAIREMGFDSASPIQEQSIPMELSGKDVIGQAQTGTGKTAAFGIPMLMKAEIASHKLQGVILCPTRELAIQVSEELHRYARHMTGLRILPVYGGQDILKQIRGLKDGPQIMVGTPGRVLDHMRRGTVSFENVRMIVLDEADEMLDMGFIDDMKDILSALPEERQTVMFSATMPTEIQELASDFMKDPEVIRIARKELTVPEITQYYYDIRPSIKTEVLCRLIDLYEPKLSVIFCNTKLKVDELTDEMKGRGYYAEGLHGDMSQAQRDRVMNGFRKHRFELLIATDVMARGIDVEDIEAVFNYDIPYDDEYYVHRIGRTGRAGRKGYAFSLVVGRDIYKLREIQKFCRTTIHPQQVPTRDDISQIRTDRVLNEAASLLEEDPSSVRELGDLVDRYIQDHDISAHELAAALLKLRLGTEEIPDDELEEMPMPRSLDDLGKSRDGGRRRRDRDRYGRDDRDERSEGRSHGKDDEHHGRRRKEGHEDDDMVRLFINVGRNQGIKPGDLVGAIAGEANIKGKMVGAIDLYDSYSFVEVDRSHAEQVMQAMKNAKIRGMKVRMEKALGRED